MKTTSNEETRLAALYSIALLDTPAEERFDRITRLAQRLFDAPIALMTLVDRDRQFCKSRQGLSDTEHARSSSFCHQALLENGTFVVEDASADPRFKEHELVRGAAKVRFYAGHPIATHDGHKVGMLCVLDRQPRRFTDEQSHLLADLAHMLESELHKVQFMGMRSAATAAREDLQKFFSLSLDMLCIAGVDGYFKQINPAWEATLGWTLAELTGRPYVEFVHPDDYERTVSEARLLEKGNITVAFENRYRCRDGSYRRLLWSAVSEQQSGLIYSVARDITALRAAEDEVRRSRAAAEAANMAKNRFLANMSQEFRTPLNSVLGFTSVLLEEVPDLSERHRSFLGRIQSNGRDLLFMVNDVLDLAMIESGQADLAREPVDLSALITSVAARQESQARQKGLEIRTEAAEPLSPLVTDPRRLRQVLVNLVANAVQFTESGHVTLRVVADAMTGSPERLEIEDTGMGIAYEQQGRDFTAFQQDGDGDSRRSVGSGLGLAIARSLCELMGYRLRLWTRAGVGTTFSVHFAPPGREVP